MVFLSSGLLFASEEGQSASGNRGYFQGSIPEKKKGTVIFEGGPKSGKGLDALAQEEKLSELQKQAREYRQKGFEEQRLGNLAGAFSYYQKAIELDPAYVVPYNDLGVVLEQAGDTARAEEFYLKAIQVDPNFLSSYTNLALIYEDRRDIEKAAYYWQKRADLGQEDDPWAKRAKERLNDIQAVSKPISIQAKREQEIVGLMSEVAAKKELLLRDDKAMARESMSEAQKAFRDGDYAEAVRRALDAQKLDPENSEIEKFIERARNRALTR